MLLAEEVEVSDDEEDDGGIQEITIDENVVNNQPDSLEIIVDMKVEGAMDEEEDGNIPPFCCLCYSPYENSDVEKHNTEVHAEDQEALTMDFSEENLKFRCKYCPLRFLTDNLLSTHMRSRHTDTTTMVDCQVCEKTVRSVRLKEHMETHVEKKLECKLCYTKFSIQKYLDRHQKSVHRLEEHLLEQDLTESDLNFECYNDQCGKRFASEFSLNYHKKHGHRESSFYCTFCPEIFPTATFLRKHCKQVHRKRITHTRKENTCKLCYKAFQRRSNLMSHKRIHKEDKKFFEREISESDLRFMCTDESCQQRFVSQKILDYHALRNHSTRRDIEFKHLKKSSKKGVIHSCPLCYIQFKSFYTMHDHILDIHHQDKDLLKEAGTEETLIYDCAKCQYSFFRPSLLEYHSNRIHGRKSSSKTSSVAKSPESKRQCSLCYEPFRKSKYLQNHIQSMHQSDKSYLDETINESDKQFECKRCESWFVSNNSIDIHFKRNHEEAKKSCELCYLKFKNPSGFQKHKKRLHMNEMDGFDKKLERSQFEFSCKVCDKKFWTENILNYHVRYKHKKTDRQTQKGSSTKSENWCDLCFKRFDRPGKLEKHKTFLHKQEMDLFGQQLEESALKYACKECDQKFWSENILDHHLRYKHKVHRLKEDQECELCGKIFKWNKDQRRNLREHMRKVHTGDNNPQIDTIKIDRSCKLCFITFDRPSKLEKHKTFLHKQEMAGFDLKLEESQLVHPCEVCGKKFWTENILEYHVRCKHKGEEIKKDKECKLCGKVFKWEKNRKKKMSGHMATVHKTTPSRVQQDSSALDNFNVMMKMLSKTIR